jgi:hypothetical protein
MAVTLAQAKLMTTDAYDLSVIDEFQRSSSILNALTFDNIVSPVGNGGTMTYTYQRQKTKRKASTRAINSEYTPGKADVERKSVDLKIIGGSYQIDRVLADQGTALVNEVKLQSSELIEAATAKFSYDYIRGDSAVDANGFDGISKAVTGTSTEVTATADWSTVATKAAAITALAEFDAWLRRFNGKPDVLYANSLVIAKFKVLAQWSDQIDRTTDAFGRTVVSYDGISLEDLGVVTTTDDSASEVDVMPMTTSYGDIIGVRYGLKDVHAIAKTGQLVKTWLPDFTTAGAVKTGEVEIVAAPVVKRTRSAGAFRSVKVL